MPPKPPASPDPEPEDENASGISEELLLKHFKEKPLTSFLEVALPRAELISLAPALHLNPLPGKRLKTMKPAEHARLLAKQSLEDPRIRTALVEKLQKHLPAPLLSGELDGNSEALVRDLLPALDRKHWLGLMLSLLKSDGLHAMAVEEILTPSFHRGRAQQRNDELRKTKGRLTRAEERASEAEAKLKKAGADSGDHDQALKDRIEGLQREVTTLGNRLGEKNKECDEIREEWEKLKSDLRVAFNRAARFKKALDETKQPSEREKELNDSLAGARQQASLNASKLEILEYQLDLLEQEEEPVSETKKNRETEFRPVVDGVARYVSQHGSPPRILVVGGAGKQKTHREKDFSELITRLGILGEWRFADYTSWHRELPRLKNDMRNRFDLLFVLHWNRTTFVQKMHDEARAANIRLRTVPYRGFLSLELAIHEELLRFVQDGN